VSITGDGSYLNTLGIAQYRVGQYRAAVDTLARSEAINSTPANGSHPADLAFLTMARYERGQKDKAQESLRRLREALKREQWAENAEAHAFLREAETLLQEATKAPRSKLGSGYSTNHFHFFSWVLQKCAWTGFP